MLACVSGGAAGVAFGLVVDAAAGAILVGGGDGAAGAAVWFVDGLRVSGDAVLLGGGGAEPGAAACGGVGAADICLGIVA